MLVNKRGLPLFTQVIASAFVGSLASMHSNISAIIASVLTFMLITFILKRFNKKQA